MKKTTPFPLVFFTIVFTSCQNPNPSNASKNIDNIDYQVDDDNQVLKNADYYKSKGYQVFSEYDLALSCPCNLEDGSTQISEQYDFNYGCIENQNSKSNLVFYQILINKLPFEYKNLGAIEKEDFENKMLNLSGIKECKGFVFCDSINTKVCDYTKGEFSAKAMFFVWNGRTYIFNLITNDNLEGKFNTWLKQIALINNTSNRFFQHKKVFKVVDPRELQYDYFEIKTAADGSKHYGYIEKGGNPKGNGDNFWSKMIPLYASQSNIKELYEFQMDFTKSNNENLILWLKKYFSQNAWRNIIDKPTWFNDDMGLMDIFENCNKYKSNIKLRYVDKDKSKICIVSYDFGSQKIDPEIALVYMILF